MDGLRSWCLRLALATVLVAAVTLAVAADSAVNASARQVPAAAAASGVELGEPVHMPEGAVGGMVAAVVIGAGALAVQFRSTHSSRL